MLKVFKYAFKVDDAVSLSLPIGYRILHVDHQDSSARDTACLWALVDPDAEHRPVAYRVYGTGFNIDPSKIGKHVATWQDHGAVWHLFEAPGT